MSALTRRRDPAAHHETWLIHHGDVHIGTIRIRAGVPGSVNQWGWTCGFYPASHRGVSADGTAMSFEAARADFEAAWCQLLSKITESDFDDYRRNRAFVFDEAGETIELPYQRINVLLLGPGTTVTHDAVRHCSAHGMALAFVGTDGTRIYTAPPIFDRDADLARRQATYWCEAHVL